MSEENDSGEVRSVVRALELLQALNQNDCSATYTGACGCPRPRCTGCCPR